MTYRVFSLLLFGVLTLLAACRELPADRLYALHLDRAPRAADWERALPRTVYVKGGRENRPKKLGDIDEDTVHTSTASCHHGASLPDPVAVDMRAFYTDTDLYLRLSWADATRDDAIREWTFDGLTWHSRPTSEDGFGLLWDTVGIGDFSCSYACHIDDFGVQGANFHARNKMKLPEESGRSFDLWNWKARRTGSYGFADDRVVDRGGVRGDVPGELFEKNSHFASRASAEAFSDGDAPLYDFEGEAIDGTFRPPGSRAPGYLVSRPTGGRADVAARQNYEKGRWTVVLTRRLRTADSHDVIFRPGRDTAVAFGLSLMDNTLYEHYASVATERLVLVPEQE